MKILIGIHGSATRPEYMQAQLDTWVNYDGDFEFEYFTKPDGPLWDGGHRTLVLNRRTEALVRYGLENGFDYVFKCDDDTYIRVPELLDSGFEHHDYSGFTEPHWTRRTGHYRWAQGGAGYWLSRRAMEIIDANGLHLARAEDFAAGELLAQHGITPHHDDRYTPVNTSHRSDWITLHKVTPQQMRALHAAL